MKARYAVTDDELKRINIYIKAMTMKKNKLERKIEAGEELNVFETSDLDIITGAVAGAMVVKNIITGEEG